MSDLTPADQVFFDLAQVGIAMGGALACLVALLCGMHFVKALWS